MLTAQFTPTFTGRGRLNSAWAALLVCTVSLLAYVALQPEVTRDALIVRNALGLVTIGWSVHATRKAL